MDALLEDSSWEDLDVAVNNKVCVIFDYYIIFFGGDKINSAAKKRGDITHQFRT